MISELALTYELQKRGSAFLTLAHVQAAVLLANFEGQQGLFPQGAMSQCRSLRMAQMLKLHQIDSGAKAATSLEPLEPEARISLEEKRRTWWIVYCSDRFLSSITGWPSLIRDEDVRSAVST